MHTPALTNFELFWEKSMDTKLLLAWSKSTVVLAFRGTASMANIFADIQVHTVSPFCQPAKKRTCLSLCTHPHADLFPAYEGLLLLMFKSLAYLQTLQLECARKTAVQSSFATFIACSLS